MELKQLQDELRRYELQRLIQWKRDFVYQIVRRWRPVEGSEEILAEVNQRIEELNTIIH